MEEEFDALGMPFDHRGPRGDEFLEIFDALYTQESITFDGRFSQFGPVGFAPKPVRGHIPIWVGGHSTPAYRRTARYGDAFHAVFSPPETVAEQWAEVGSWCEELGRDRDEVELTLRLRLAIDLETDDEGALRGSAESIVEQVAAYGSVSVSHITLDVRPIAAEDVDGQMEAMRRFADGVLPHVR